MPIQNPTTPLPSAISSCVRWVCASRIPPLTGASRVLTSIVDLISGATLTNNSQGSPQLVDSSEGYKCIRFNPPSGTTQALVDTTLAIPAQTAVVLGVVKSRVGMAGAGTPFALAGSGGSGGSYPTGAGLAASGSSYQYYWSGAGGVQGAINDLNATNTNTRHLVGFINSGSGNTSQTQIVVNGALGTAITNSTSPYATVAGSSPYTTGGYYIGCLNGTYQYAWYGDVYDLIILNNPSAADITAAINYLNTTYDLPIAPSPLGQVMWINGGNSLAFGVDATAPYFAWWNKVLNQATVPMDFRLVAKSGQTTPHLTTRLPIDVYPLYDPDRVLTIYTFLEGINDFNLGSNATQCIANYATHFQAVAANMPNAIIGATTVGPTSQMDETDRATFNAGVRANWQSWGCEFLIDIAADPTIGQAGQNGSPYYDGAYPATHLSNAGMQYYANLWLAQMKPFLLAAKSNPRLAGVSPSLFSPGNCGSFAH